MKKKVLLKCLAIVLAFFVSEFGLSQEYISKAESEVAEVKVEETEAKETSASDVQQKNAVNMLNYIRAFAQEINASSNSSLYLEELYSSLLNNIHPNAVDQATLNEVMNLLDALEEYRMISVKRERLEYLYEQNQAKVIKESVPDPVGLLGVINSDNRARMALAVLYMAVDAETSYQAAMQEADLEYIQEGWKLDDAGMEILHESRKDLFKYMVNMVEDYELDGGLVLSDDMIEKFVARKNDDNVVSKIQFFESNQAIYQAFGTYWLELAKCYYENGDYGKCIGAINSYEALGITIFRKNYELAEILPLAILSANEELTGEQHLLRVSEYCQMILDNTDEEEWELRYFVAQTYMDLFVQTKDNEFLEKAYEIVLNNVNSLVHVQEELNEEYLADIVEEEIPDDVSKEQKKELKNYNKQLKEARKTELAPIYEPLVVNCDLLFVLADKIEISEAEKDYIDQILHDKGEKIFLVTAIDNLYRFQLPIEEINEENIEVSFNGDEVVIPAEYVSADTEITVEVSGAEKAEFTDWKVLKVDRKKSEEFADFTVTFKSTDAHKFEYGGDESISIKVIAKKDCNTIPLEFSFVAVRDKRVDVLDEWEWLDKASDWSDVVHFERNIE